jgi:serine/threonine protein kinase
MTDVHYQYALPPGTMVQEYRIDQVLGVGGFGIVYTAENTHFHETVAIKEFLPTDFACRKDETGVVPLSSESEETYRWALKKFLDEARTLRELGRPNPHRNIVRVRQFIEANGTAYMVMDYEKGRSLSQILNERVTLPQNELQSILEPLLDGLERVHAAPVWHRDIKPSNILIRPDGSPVLIDFGAARREVAGADRTVFAMFSPAYAAPEQVDYTAGRQGPWTDIYALGATLYHAVTGDKPRNAAERRQGADYASAVQTAAGSYTPIFLAAIDAALQLKPESRPQSIAAWRQLFDEDDATVNKPALPKTMNPVNLAGEPITIPIPIPENISLETPSPPDIVGRSRTFRTGRRFTVITFVIVLTAALGLAGVLSRILSWPFGQKHESTSVTLPPVKPRIKPRIIPPEKLPIKPPGLDTVRTHVQDILATLACADVIARLSADRHLTISGFASSTKEIQQVRHKLSSVEGIASVTDELVVHSWPFCEMLKLLQQYKTSNYSLTVGTQLEINKPNGRYSEGEFLVVNAIAGQSFDGYLYIDYLDHEGTVVHMLPTPDRENNAVRAGQKIVVGAEEHQTPVASHYKIGPPHGSNLLVAIASEQALFDAPRPQMESARDYFAALGAALQSATLNNPSAAMTAAHLFIDTYKKPE